MKPAALQALADAADALARLAREAAQDDDVRDAALVPLREAARIAATSARVVRDAIRNGELAAYGRARDRAIRRSDLNAWIASREVKPIRAIDDADMDRRIARLARSKALRQSAIAVTEVPPLEGSIPAPHVKPRRVEP